MNRWPFAHSSFWWRSQYADPDFDPLDDSANLPRELNWLAGFARRLEAIFAKLAVILALAVIVGIVSVLLSTGRIGVLVIAALIVLELILWPIGFMRRRRQRLRSYR